MRAVCIFFFFFNPFESRKSSSEACRIHSARLVNTTSFAPYLATCLGVRFEFSFVLWLRDDVLHSYLYLAAVPWCSRIAPTLPPKFVTTSRSSSLLNKHPRLGLFIIVVHKRSLLRIHLKEGRGFCVLFFVPIFRVCARHRYPAIGALFPKREFWWWKKGSTELWYAMLQTALLAGMLQEGLGWSLQPEEQQISSGWCAYQAFLGGYFYAKQINNNNNINNTLPHRILRENFIEKFSVCVCSLFLLLLFPWRTKLVNMVVSGIGERL